MGVRSKLFLRGYFLFILAVCPSCSSQIAHQATTPDSPEAISLLEMECETQLRHLASVIKSKAAVLPNSDPSLIELKEIYAMSEELFLKREFSLVVSLIDDALQLIEENGF
jgi:hypothetical protein